MHYTMKHPHYIYTVCFQNYVQDTTYLVQYTDDLVVLSKGNWCQWNLGATLVKAEALYNQTTIMLMFLLHLQTVLCCVQNKAMAKRGSGCISRLFSPPSPLAKLLSKLLLPANSKEELVKAWSAPDDHGHRKRYPHKCRITLTACVPPQRQVHPSSLPGNQVVNHPRTLVITIPNGI